MTPRPGCIARCLDEPDMRQSTSNRVLVVTREPSHPATAGNRIRIQTLLDTMRRLGLEVHLAFFPQDRRTASEQVSRMREHWGESSVHVLELQMAPVPPLTRRTRRIRSALWRRIFRWPALWVPLGLDEWEPVRGREQLKALVRQLRPAAIQAEYVFESWALECAPTGCLKVLDTHDRFSNRHWPFLRSGQEKDLWYYTSPASERRGLRRADLAIAIQDAERDYFQRLTGRPVVTVGHLLDVATAPSTVSEPVVTFIGSGNPGNRDAMPWLVDHVWPRVRSRFPAARLEVYGGICQWVQPQQGIELRGVVDDLDEAYQRAAVVVCPLRLGTGLKIKCVEALAKGKALVTTSVGAEGLVEQGRDHLVVADEPGAFAEAITRLLSEPAQRIGLERQALAFARQWQMAQEEALRSIYAPLLAHSRNREAKELSAV